MGVLLYTYTHHLRVAADLFLYEKVTFVHEPLQTFLVPFSVGLYVWNVPQLVYLSISVSITWIELREIFESAPLLERDEKKSEQKQNRIQLGIIINQIELSKTTKFIFTMVKPICHWLWSSKKKSSNVHGKK